MAQALSLSRVGCAKGRGIRARMPESPGQWEFASAVLRGAELQASDWTGHWALGPGKLYNTRAKTHQEGNVFKKRTKIQLFLKT